MHESVPNYQGILKRNYICELNAYEQYSKLKKTKDFK